MQGRHCREGMEGLVGLEGMVLAPTDKCQQCRQASRRRRHAARPVLPSNGSNSDRRNQPRPGHSAGTVTRIGIHVNHDSAASSATGRGSGRRHPLVTVHLPGPSQSTGWGTRDKGLFYGKRSTTFVHSQMAFCARPMPQPRSHPPTPRVKRALGDGSSFKLSRSWYPTHKRS